MYVASAGVPADVLLSYRVEILFVYILLYV